MPNSICLLSVVSFANSALRRSCSVVSVGHLHVGEGITIVETLPLGVHDVGQCFVDFVVHAPQVVVLEPFLALLSQLLEHFAKALDPLAVVIFEAVLHQPS